MRAMVEDVEKLTDERGKKIVKISADETTNCDPKTVLIHCWRGGMRSGAVAWLLDLYGFKVLSLSGGYKAFRNWVLQQFEKEYSFRILGGYTGSGKTYLLHELKNQGEKIIDLEQLACHKGSAFGNIGFNPQPSQEMFENMLAVELDEAVNSFRLPVTACRLADDSENAAGGERGPADGEELQTTNIKLQTPIWLEDESQRIGLVNIPMLLWKTMRQQPVYFLNISFEERLQHIVNEYGKADKEKLVNAILRIQKRLGGLETKTALNFLVENNIKECFRILLTYYDKHYLKALNNRETGAPLITKIECCNVDAKENAKQLLHLVKK